MNSSLPSLDITKGPSKPLWLLNSCRSFIIASIKRSLNDESNEANANIQTVNFKNLWKASIQKKCKYFLWTVYHDCLNTLDVLQKRCPNMALSLNWCSSCKVATEDLDHIFIHCSKAKNIWKMVQDATKVIIQGSSAKFLCTNLCKMKQNSIRSIIKFNTIAITMWTIWIDRNNIIFNEKNISNLDSLKNICNLVGIWSTRHRLLKNYKQSTISLNIQTLCS